MSLHRSASGADNAFMEALEAFEEQPIPEDGADEAIVEGDHPDPVVLSEPSFDDSGRLVWGSMPMPGLLGHHG